MSVTPENKTSKSKICITSNLALTIKTCSFCSLNYNYDRSYISVWEGLHMEAASALISLSPWEGASVTLSSPPWTEGSPTQKGQPRAQWGLTWGLASLSAHC